MNSIERNKSAALTTTGTQQKTSEGFRAIFAHIRKQISSFISRITSGGSVKVSPAQNTSQSVASKQGLNKKGIESLIKNSENSKTLKELMPQLRGETKTYSKELKEGNFSSTQLNGKQNKNDGTVDRGLTRASAECIVDQHGCGLSATSKTANTLGSGTISSMMVDDMFDIANSEAQISQGISSEITTAANTFTESGIEADVLANISDNLKVDNDTISGYLKNPNSLIESDLPNETKTKIYNAITTMSRGLSMLKASAGQCKGKNVNIIRRGFVNQKKDSTEKIDGNEKQMVQNEQNFAEFLNGLKDGSGNSKEVFGKQVHYAYVNTNVQGSAKNEKLTYSDLDSFTNMLSQYTDTEKAENPSYTQAGDALITLKSDNLSTEDRLNALEKFERCIKDLDGNNTQVIYHCKTGKDRTGGMAQGVGLMTSALDQINQKAENGSNLKTCRDFDKAKKLIDDLPDNKTKSTLKGILDNLKEDQKTAQSFNARQHCAKVMNETSGEGKAKLGELNYTLFQRIGGNSVINSELTSQNNFFAFGIRMAKGIGISN